MTAPPRPIGPASAPAPASAPGPSRASGAPLAGIGLMLLAMAILPGIDVLAKLLGAQGLPVAQIVWARVAFGTLITLPFALHQGGARALWPDRPATHGLRAFLLVVATFLFFQSVQYLPIADALAIFFVQPLVLTALSPIILGERVGPRRWAAVALGFAGTLVIIRPGLQAVNPGHLFALSAGTALAVYFLLTRRVANSAPAMAITYWTNLIGAAGLTLLAPLYWVAPTPAQWAMFAALGAIAVAGHLFITLAYERAEASLLAPLAYTEMVTSTLMGWVFFGDLPDRFTFLGVGILIGCALYISARERAAQTYT